MKRRVRDMYTIETVDRSRTWKKWGFMGGFVVVLTLALYPIVISPILWPEYWQEQQRKNRAGLDIEKIQPGGMKVWTDPFDRKKPKEES